MEKNFVVLFVWPHTVHYDWSLKDLSIFGTRILKKKDGYVVVTTNDNEIVENESHWFLRTVPKVLVDHLNSIQIWDKLNSNLRQWLKIFWKSYEIVWQSAY